MHRHRITGHSSARSLSQLNFLFSGWRTLFYDALMVRLAKGMYQGVVDDVTPAYRGGKVLDVGTGPGTLVREIARSQPGLEVHGIDLATSMVELARSHATKEGLGERVHFMVADAAHLPYADNSFDLIVSTLSMHHWYELAQPLRELYRVLKPGGRLWIYDFGFMEAELKKVLPGTPFAGTELEQRAAKRGLLPGAVKRFALEKIEV